MKIITQIELELTKEESELLGDMIVFLENLYEKMPSNGSIGYIKKEDIWDIKNVCGGISEHSYDEESE